MYIDYNNFYIIVDQDNEYNYDNTSIKYIE